VECHELVAESATRRRDVGGNSGPSAPPAPGSYRRESPLLCQRAPPPAGTRRLVDGSRRNRGLSSVSVRRGCALAEDRPDSAPSGGSVLGELLRQPKLQRRRRLVQASCPRLVPPSRWQSTTRQLALWTVGCCHQPGRIQSTSSTRRGWQAWRVEKRRRGRRHSVIGVTSRDTDAQV